MIKLYKKICLILLTLVILWGEVGVSSRENYYAMTSITDSLGRSTEDYKVKKYDENKKVLMFYHIWHHSFMIPTCNVDSKGTS